MLFKIQKDILSVVQSYQVFPILATILSPIFCYWTELIDKEELGKEYGHVVTNESYMI